MHITIDSSLGTIPSYENNQMEISFDAGNLDLGEYSAVLQIASNDPNSRLSFIPTTMTIIDPTEVLENADSCNQST